jgi:hypothetical protein
MHAEFDRLLTEYGDAHYEAGEWRRDESDTTLDEILDRAEAIARRLREILARAASASEAPALLAALHKYVRWIEDDRIRSQRNQTADYILDDARAILRRIEAASASGATA